MRRVTTLAILLAACARPAPVDEEPLAPVERALGEHQFEHQDQDGRDPFDILRQQIDEPPAPIAARLHSCQKLPYASLGALLASRGVDLKAVAKMGELPRAGQLYAAGQSALGAPNYGARTREAVQLNASVATKLFDIFLMAAPEIIKAMPGVKACVVDGTPAAMFDPMTGECTEAGITCLSGSTATMQHQKLCNQLVKDGGGGDVARAIAVATILASAHTCE